MNVTDVSSVLITLHEVGATITILVGTEVQSVKRGDEQGVQSGLNPRAPESQTNAFSAKHTENYLTVLLKMLTVLFLPLLLGLRQKHLHLPLSAELATLVE